MGIYFTFGENNVEVTFLNLTLFRNESALKNEISISETGQSKFLCKIPPFERNQLPIEVVTTI